jgi:hypothetical protein
VDARLEEAFWPDKEIGQASLKVAMARTRSWLGAEWLEDANRTRIYRLTPGFLFDWSLFRQLTARAKARGRLGADDRRAALELVRGRPLHGADVQTTGRKPYTWLAKLSHRSHAPRRRRRVVWATSWMSEANDVIAPILGLPTLPLVDWPDEDLTVPRLHWKTVGLVSWSAGRAFV